MDPLLLELGMLLIFAGFAALAIAMLIAFARGSSTKVEGGGLVLIGPIPIVFSSSKRVAIALMALALAIMALYVLAVWLMST